MRTAFRIAFLAFAIAAVGTTAFAQDPLITERAHAVERVEPNWPVNAVSQSLGGPVWVLVNLDNAGNVLSVEVTDGPGTACAAASGPDISAR